jgi:hypothetical protein
MIPRSDLPRVLAVTRDRASLRALRIEMPLVNLKKQGFIEDYFVSNPSLFDVPDDYIFDVVWLQRANDPRLIQHVMDKTDGCYIYDIDDLLIGRAAYRSDPLVNRNAVIEAVIACKVLTVTSARLKRLLASSVSVSLDHKTIVCPNAHEFPTQIRPPAQPRGLLFSSSEELPLTESREEVLRAVRDFTDRFQLPVYCFGPSIPRHLSKSGRCISFGIIPFWHYHALLGSLPSMIGLAPLETAADRETLDFVCGKSDIKILTFGGFGHPAVYSAAPPYVDTDLTAGLLVENTYHGWFEGMERIHGHAWRLLGREQREIVKKRNMDRIARECWTQAVGRARMSRPLSGKDIFYSSGRSLFFVNAAKQMVFSQDHLFLKRLEARIPRPLLRILRKRLLNT